MVYWQIYRVLLWLVTFLRVHSNSKEVSYLSKQNTYPNLKTTCHIKLNSFLWTKLLENLLLAKHLISATADLSYDIQLTACMNCVKLWRKKLRVFREALHWKSFLRRNRKIISQSFWGQNINFFLPGQTSQMLKHWLCTGIITEPDKDFELHQRFFPHDKKKLKAFRIESR